MGLSDLLARSPKEGVDRSRGGPLQWHNGLEETVVFVSFKLNYR